ncbi:MAG: histidine kinase [Saprospiraceae bacterium]|nr:histidine kinase [Saprospiraceae bacterium]
MKYFFLLLNIVIQTHALGQQPDIVFHHITQKDGLSYNIINCFLKDSRGILWIGTYNGLNKYDGAHFYTFHGGPNKNTLPNNTVHKLAEDKQGNIWGATDNGVFCLNPVTGYFKNYQLPTKNGRTGVYNILCDSKGVIWAANYFNLVFYNKVTDRFQKAENNTKFPDLDIRKNGLEESPDGNGFWITDKQGLIYYDKKARKFSRIFNNTDKNPAKNSGASSLCKTKHGHFWYVDNDAKKIIGFDPLTKKEKYLISTPEITKSGQAATLFEDNNHMLWLSTWKYELFMIDYLNGNNITKIRHNKNDVSSIAGDFFWDAFQETDGTLWLGTVGGISKSNHYRSFYKVHHFQTDLNSTENPSINFVSENPWDKTWWIGTNKQIIMQYNPATSKTTKYALDEFIPNADKKTPTGVYRMIFLKDSTLLFSYYGAWIKKKGTNNFSPITLPPPFTSWVLRDAVLYNQKILYCTAVDKLLKWDLQTGKLDSLVFTKPFINEKNRLYLGVPKVDKNGKVWILNGTNWLTYTDQNQLHPLQMKYQDTSAADDGYFTSMIMDRKGDLWMSKKGDGLIYYNPSKNLSKQYKQYDGLVMDHIMATAEDASGKIWSACYNQFSVFNPLLKSFYNFTLPISGNNYNYVNFMTPLKNGNIIASIRGDVVEFYTERLKRTQVQDKPLISMVAINGLDSNFDSKKALELAPDENSLRIKFGMLTDNLITPYEMLYMLEGVENNWSHISTNFEASYNSLLPGDYIFKVKAVAKDKSWQTDDTTLAIHIATPFYKTWWFLLLLLMATAGAITTLYRWRINQKDKLRMLESKSQMLEKEKARVMYESLKQQLNPHFLFNSLTSLSGLIELDQELAGSFLTQMSGIYRYILKNGDRESVTLKDELEFVKLYISLQQTRFSKGLKFEINVREEFLHYKIAPVTLQNLIENAIKHNIIDAETPLVIEIYVEEEYIVVKNNLNKKNMVETSNKKGLAQFKKLYKYLSDKPIIVEENKECFIIKIPLL